MTELTQSQKDIAINDILNDFYKLKEKYEKDYYEKYVKNIVKYTNKASNKEKKKQFARLPKPQCINCERNVGTIFSIKNTDIIRNFIVKCGDLVDPCPLNINFNYGMRDTYESSINSTTKQLNYIKNLIVKEKNNVIFGFTLAEDVTDKFNKLSEELKENTDFNGFLIEKNILINHNPAKKEFLEKLTTELQNNYILPFNNLIKTYEQSDNNDYVKEAVQMYISEIMPKLKEIQKLKYEVNVVEYDTDDKTFHLIQKPNNLYSLQYELTNDDEIISNIKGVKSTKKTRKITKPTKAKTLKLKPTIELVEDETEVIEE